MSWEGGKCLAQSDTVGSYRFKRLKVTRLIHAGPYRNEADVVDTEGLVAGGRVERSGNSHSNEVSVVRNGEENLLVGIVHSLLATERRRRSGASEGFRPSNDTVDAHLGAFVVPSVDCDKYLYTPIKISSLSIS